jgi:hypothetical protein
MMPTKSNWNLTTITLIVGLLVTFATTVGAFYEVRTSVASQAESLTTLRSQHEECERAAQRKWDALAARLDEMLSRGVRNETKIDAILTMLKEDHGGTR